MGKDNVLEYPKLDNEVIEVTNFLVIKEATMKCGDITVLVGEQATGKSLLAKLRYFFWDYQQGLWEFILLHNWNNSKGKDIDKYNESKIKFFNELFPNIENVKNEFYISFESGDIFISIKRGKKGSKVKIEQLRGLDIFIKGIQNIVNEKQYKKQNLVISLDEVNFQSMPSVLYVPASRLFFATIEGNPFQFFDSKTYSFDFLLRRFGNFWVNQKKGFSKDFKDSKKSDTWFNNARTILAGDYVHKDEIDYIKTTWGETVELKDASSGQQEVVPLLAAIKSFPNEIEKNQLLIIEEPEAHIYPLSLPVLIKMIADIARDNDCKAMITTHSPYIPACVDNEILIAQNKNKPLAVSAYHLSKRTLQDIHYDKKDMIDLDKLDEVSDIIADEYYELTQKQDAIKKGKSSD